MSIGEILFATIFLVAFVVFYILMQKYISYRAKSEGLTNDDFVRKEFDATSERIIEFVSKDWDKEN
tara:strand:- start:416 stop:613 length:198 start_codon:yes stop_codon:yes gene_type:complete